jgi:hypothetical protein
MSLSVAREQKNKLLYVGFNQDYSCFAIGTDDGFEIWNVDPFKLRFKRGTVPLPPSPFLSFPSYTGGGQNSMAGWAL